MTIINEKQINLSYHSQNDTEERGYSIDGYVDLEQVMPSNFEVTKIPLRKMNVGIEEKDREKIAQGLSRLLADTYTLYLRTHNFHWNITGPMFQSLHQMFMVQHQELALAVDLIAERIRALGFPAPASYAEFADLTSIKEVRGSLSAENMIESLWEGQEVVIRTARQILPVADKFSDLPTADLLTQRMQIHEKTAWMLRSLLGQKH
jgi:starvation-inducible DNA-binding protein